MSQEQNRASYEEKYRNGYGVSYPDGHVIRLYEKFLKYELGMTGGNFLDIGCGNGCHAEYFKSKGFSVHGFDISSAAIEIAKKRLPEEEDRFLVQDMSQASINSIFKDRKFDLIFSNQVLYYMEENEIKNKISEINDILPKDGIVYFTMMSSDAYYYNLSQEIENSSRRKVILKDRLNEETDIHFLDSKDEMVKLFGIFEPVFVGHYDISMREGSGMHYQFLGKKR